MHIVDIVNIVISKNRIFGFFGFCSVFRYFSVFSIPMSVSVSVSFFKTIAIFVFGFGCRLGSTVHMGQRGVTIAINFGTKIAINAYKCTSTTDNGNVITYNRGVFVVDQSKEDISDCKGLRDVAMATKFWPK